MPLNMTLPLEVGIGCHHLPTMRDFYEGTLGLEFVSEARAPEQIPQNYRLARSAATVAFLRDPEGNVVELVQYDDVAAYRPDLA